MIATGHLKRPSKYVLSLDGIELNREGREFDFIVDRMDGWDGSPGIKQGGVDRPSRHGTYTERVLRQSRAITLEGTAYGADETAIKQAEEHLSALLGSGDSKRLSVTQDYYGTRWSDVTLGSSIAVFRGGDFYFDFQFTVLAADPVKYGPVREETIFMPSGTGQGLEYPLFTDSVDDTGFLEFGDKPAAGVAYITNTGTAETTPTFVVHGPTEGFEIYEATTRSVFTYTQWVPHGSTLTIAPSGSVLLDGSVDRSAALTRRDWWTLPPGVQRVVSILTGVGDPTLTIQYSSGWW